MSEIGSRRLEKSSGVSLAASTQSGDKNLERVDIPPLASRTISRHEHRLRCYVAASDAELGSVNRALRVGLLYVAQVQGLLGGCVGNRHRAILAHARIAHAQQDVPPVRPGHPAADAPVRA